ncbi:MAG: helix-turn-helix transcriptional regulator [Mucispirillum sp.]|nr:helix-turn-helix transcriptional regulator [Mucispirillum sp.]
MIKKHYELSGEWYEEYMKKVTERGLSFNKLAKEIGISPNWFTRLKHRQSKKYKHEVLEKISDYLGIDKSKIYEEMDKVRIQEQLYHNIKNWNISMGEIAKRLNVSRQGIYQTLTEFCTLKKLYEIRDVAVEIMKERQAELESMYMS